MQSNNIPSSNSKMSHETSDQKTSDNIVWVRCEMTGSDLDVDEMMGIACLVTDGQLNIIAESPDITIYQPPEVLNKMDEWWLNKHGESGLLEKCRQSKITMREAEKILLEFVRKWTPFKKCPMGCSNYMDRLFLKKHMFEFEQHMLYRIIDISSIKDLCGRWYPDVSNPQQRNKEELLKYQAIDIIKQCIEELLFYKDRVFLKPSFDQMSSQMTDK